MWLTPAMDGIYTRLQGLGHAVNDIVRIATVEDPRGLREGLRFFIDNAPGFRPPSLADHHLTPHELRLLGLLTGWHSHKSAAAALGSSVDTIAFHMKRIYAKLHVHSKSEAVAKALRHRIAR
jgi:DNA-binding CsgD family transcriptional regulator